jgi:hypothetical protein
VIAYRLLSCEEETFGRKILARSCLFYNDEKKSLTAKFQCHGKRDCWLG